MPDPGRQIAELETQLAEQRAEMTGCLSEAFQAIPACYDTPADLRALLPVPPLLPSTCEGDCNPFVSTCGVKFCEYEAMAAHDRLCGIKSENKSAPEPHDAD